MTNKSTKREFENLNRDVNRVAEQTDRVLSKVTELEESFEEYTEKELHYIDKYKAMTDNTMEDEDLYEIIIKQNFDDNKIKQEINEYIKLVKKKGDEYGWTKIEKGKSKIIQLLIFLEIKPEKIPEVKEQPYKNTQSNKKRYDRSERPERNERPKYQRNYQRNKPQEEGVKQEEENNQVYQQYNSEHTYSNRGRGFYRGRSYRGRGRSNNYYSDRNYYSNYKYNNYYNDYDLFDHELGVTYKVVEVNLDENPISMPAKNKGADAESQEDVRLPQSVEEKVEQEQRNEHEVQENQEQVEEVRVVKVIQPKEIKEINTQVNKVHSPSLEDDSIIPSNITSNINNLIEDNETPTNAVKSENVVQAVPETNVDKNINVITNNINKINYNQSVHNFQISSRKPNEELVMHSQSITLGNTNTAPKSTLTATSGTPFQINPQQTKKTIPTQTTKNPQTQQRKPDHNQTGTNVNPMMGGMPDYLSQMQGGYMPWPMVYFPQMQGMNYDPNSMQGANPMYPQMYYMQQNEMEENFAKNKKTNFPPIQNPNMNVK